MCGYPENLLLIIRRLPLCCNQIYASFVMKLDDKSCNGAPDLIVEILSPGNTRKERCAAALKQKFDAYQEAGVQEYWIFQPDDRNVFQYVLNDEGIYIGLHPLTDEDELVSRVFPNFRVDLAAVFKD